MDHILAFHATDEPVPVPVPATVAPASRHHDTLDRLLDDALDLEPSQRPSWLAGMADAYPDLVPRLREMLAHVSAGDATPAPRVGPPLDTPANDAACTELVAGDAIGPYRLLRAIGQGDLGAVWLAERIGGAAPRLVALQMPPWHLTTALDRERLLRERNVLASLDHPRIARLLDAGVSASGQPFIVREHVDGEPITRWCDRRRLGLRARLLRFVEVLDAVAHAHRHLVAHRDIKPSNVLVDAQGRSRLMDFGVARLLDDPDLGTTRALLAPLAGGDATPRYAAPEQLDDRPLTTATDVYGLGMLLHELLAGDMPYGPAPMSAAQWIAATLQQTPLPPSQCVLDLESLAARGASRSDRWQAALAGDVDAIVMKALRKAPAERYLSVDAFAEDVRRYLADQPVAARRPTRRHRLALFVRRHRIAATIAAAGACGIVAATGVAWQRHLASVGNDSRAAFSGPRALPRAMGPLDTTPPGDAPGSVGSGGTGRAASMPVVLASDPEAST
jgi:serine/threonine-protein kinase